MDAPTSASARPLTRGDLEIMKVSMLNEFQSLSKMVADRLLSHFSQAEEMQTKTAAAGNLRSADQAATTPRSSLSAGAQFSGPGRVADSYSSCSSSSDTGPAARTPKVASSTAAAPTASPFYLPASHHRVHCDAPLVTCEGLEQLMAHHLAHDPLLTLRWEQELERRLRAQTPTPGSTPLHSTGASSTPLSSCPPSPLPGPAPPRTRSRLASTADPAASPLYHRHYHYYAAAAAATDDSCSPRRSSGGGCLPPIRLRPPKSSSEGGCGGEAAYHYHPTAPLSSSPSPPPSCSTQPFGSLSASQFSGPLEQPHAAAVRPWSAAQIVGVQPGFGSGASPGCHSLRCATAATTAVTTTTVSGSGPRQAAAHGSPSTTTSTGPVRGLPSDGYQCTDRPMGRLRRNVSSDGALPAPEGVARAGNGDRSYCCNEGDGGGGRWDELYGDGGRWDELGGDVGGGCGGSSVTTEPAPAAAGSAAAVSAAGAKESATGSAPAVAVKTPPAAAYNSTSVGAASATVVDSGPTGSRRELPQQLVREIVRQMALAQFSGRGGGGRGPAAAAAAVVTSAAAATAAPGVACTPPPPRVLTTAPPATTCAVAAPLAAVAIAANAHVVNASYRPSYLPDRQQRQRQPPPPPPPQHQHPYQQQQQREWEPPQWFANGGVNGRCSGSIYNVGGGSSNSTGNIRNNGSSSSSVGPAAGVASLGASTPRHAAPAAAVTLHGNQAHGGDSSARRTASSGGAAAAAAAGSTSFSASCGSSAASPSDSPLASSASASYLSLLPHQESSPIPAASPTWRSSSSSAGEAMVVVVGAMSAFSTPEQPRGAT